VDQSVKIVLVDTSAGVDGDTALHMCGAKKGIIFYAMDFTVIPKIFLMTIIINLLVIMKTMNTYIIKMQCLCSDSKKTHTQKL